jgi:hypothetical protein
MVLGSSYPSYSFHANSSFGIDPYPTYIGSTPVSFYGIYTSPNNPTKYRKGVDKGGKDKNIGGTNNSGHVMATQTTTPRVIPPCALCDLTSHATNNCPTLLELKGIFNVDDLEPNPSTLMVQVLFLNHQLSVLSPCV